MKSLTFARQLVVSCFMIGFTGLAAKADTLSFYTGAPDLVSNNDGITNIDNTTGTSGFNNGQPYFSYVYQSFVVPAGGWTVTSVFSNDAMSYLSTQAAWEIRSGMVGGTVASPGNGGTVVASGTSADTQTITTYVDGTTPVYTVAVGGLDVSLAPGTYWLSVAPVGAGSDTSAIINTDGAGAVAAGSTTNVCNFPADGLNYVGDCTSNSRNVFSMGLYTGSGLVSTPEPAAIGLLGLGGLILLFVRRRRVAQ